jgi:tRNA pseudouridine55 synthase
MQDFELESPLTNIDHPQKAIYSSKDCIFLPKSMEGLLLVDKLEGKNSFSLVSLLRKITHIKKIGHTGTLDPFASGLMALLIGREFTKKSDILLSKEKEYDALIYLGSQSNTFDPDGLITPTSSYSPTLLEIKEALSHFQGEIWQTPPMFSAKKIQGKKLYELARKGISIERSPTKLTISITLLDYTYPHLHLNIICSKGTYIRSLSHDIGQKLKTGAYLLKLRRLRLGQFLLKDAILQSDIKTPSDITPRLITQL